MIKRVRNVESMMDTAKRLGYEGRAYGAKALFGQFTRRERDDQGRVVITDGSERINYERSKIIL